ncbi:hypothetical protein E3P99_01802 [Wallemia hederae]|uniref:DNL-type domain-containing protein n=1 Tax=Wallemia hederae TaxID=1540922 RepID=A0A4V6TME0_9BASI|nr:hypothetical protein E3P99_01802 [Wallemia hederae]
MTRLLARGIGCSYRVASRALPTLPRAFPRSTPALSSLTQTRLHSHKIPTDGSSTPIGQVDPRLQISFTCTVQDCGERSTHEFAKSSYTKGIVIVQCPGCNNRHLIADNLGWFKDDTENGKHRTVEDLMRAKGEKVRRGVLQQGGETIEFSD